METEISNIDSLFGIEIEFYIVDKNGYPVLKSNKIIQRDCLNKDPKLDIVCELASFQIEINPGPWSLSDDGLRECLVVLQYHYEILKKTVENRDWRLCETLMPTNISQEIINHEDYFTKDKRFKASCDYFGSREDVLIETKQCSINFPGESIIGSINEIHIHVQLSNDKQTIALYNYLNIKGFELIKDFVQPIKINGATMVEMNSMKLFERANGEWNNDETVFRVGNLPFMINNHEDYVQLLKTFKSIPIDSFSNLDKESTVYFWTRLRGIPGELRIEFRPMEMSENWLERVKYLYRIVKGFEIINYHKI